MINKDLLHRFVFEKIPIRGEVIYLQDTFQTIMTQHNYPPPIRQLLGEALCVVGLLSAVIKFAGRLTLQFRGKGKLRLLLAQCDNHFHMRGLVKWDGDLSEGELRDSFADGILMITLDGGEHNKISYQGIVKWRGDSLSESIEGYFRDSEQLATKVWFAVNETTAVGFLLQVIPGANTKEAEWQYIIDLTEKLTPKNLLHHDYQTLLTTLYPHEEIRVFRGTDVKFQCNCSRKRSEDAILLLGEEEAQAELKDKQVIVVTCEFCNKEYIFDPIDVTKIFATQTKHPPTQLH